MSVKDFGSPDCLPSQDRTKWWLFEGRVYAPCVLPEHKNEGRIVWNPDGISSIAPNT